MKSRTTNKWHYCKCGNRFKTRAMRDICHDLDMKILEFEPKKLIPISEYNKQTAKA